MQAGISIDDDLAQISVSNGLRQGCILALTLFILFLTWLSDVGMIIVSGLVLSYCINVVESLLVRGLNHSDDWITRMTGLSFADYAAIMAPTKEDIVRATMELNRVVIDFGLTISIPKTKLLVAGVG